MNKIIATAALSLMFIACSDNSSSTSPATASLAQVRNLSAPCINSIDADAFENIADDLAPITETSTANSSDENVSKIYPANSDGFAVVTIEHVKLGCSFEIVGVDVVAEGDTLFVNTKVEGEDDFLDCMCPRKVSFEVKYDASIENVKYTKVAGYFVSPLQKMKPENLSSSSVVPESSSSVVTDFDLASERNVALHLGECKADNLGLNKTGTSNEAYLILGEGGCQVYIPNLGDYCGILGNFLSERVGDTLRVWVDPEHRGVTKCFCIKDHWFDISASDADIKYFEYSGNVYDVVPRINAESF